jgi:hypothetical protein
MGSATEFDEPGTDPADAKLSENGCRPDRDTGRIPDYAECRLMSAWMLTFLECYRAFVNVDRDNAPWVISSMATEHRIKCDLLASSTCISDTSWVADKNRRQVSRPCP